jgi:hypothetical protein
MQRRAVYSFYKRKGELPRNPLLSTYKRRPPLLI